MGCVRGYLQGGLGGGLNGSGFIDLTMLHLERRKPPLKGKELDIYRGYICLSTQPSRINTNAQYKVESQDIFPPLSRRHN